VAPINPDRIRFDDVLWETSDPKIKGKEFQKFVKNVNWCKDIDVIRTPAILCQDIEKFPECVEWIRQQTLEEFIYPDLHGWDHGPYAPRCQPEIEEHLDKAFDWFKRNLGVLPVRWVTPHGTDTPAIQAAAANYSLVVETTTYPVIDQKQADTILRETWDTSIFEGRVIMNHWWERGLRLYRICRVLEHGGVNVAIKATKGELSEKDHGICWNGWEEPQC
jgi:hypothetical protein